MRVKSFVVMNSEIDEGGAFNIPEGWEPISVDKLKFGVSIWAYEKSGWRHTDEGWIHTDGRRLDAANI